MTTAATRLVLLLGRPVRHSGSPAIHTAAFAETGFDAVFVACDVLPDDLDDAVAGLRALGALGANVTVPHKAAALAAADAATEEARLVGAANTLFWDHGTLTADNTDAAGLEQVLRDDVGLIRGAPVVLFGAGGAARAAAVALGRVGAHVEVVARRPAAAADVAALAGRAGAAVGPVERPACVVNATPLGMHGEALPERFMDLGRDQVALDLVYGGPETPFLAAARAGGATALDGTRMLLEQAALAFRRWTGLEAPREVMRRAL